PAGAADFPAEGFDALEPKLTRADQAAAPPLRHRPNLEQPEALAGNEFRGGGNRKECGMPGRRECGVQRGELPLLVAEPQHIPRDMVAGGGRMAGDQQAAVLEQPMRVGDNGRMIGEVLEYGKHRDRRHLTVAPLQGTERALLDVQPAPPREGGLAM